MLRPPPQRLTQPTATKFRTPERLLRMEQRQDRAVHRRIPQMRPTLQGRLKTPLMVKRPHHCAFFLLLVQRVRIKWRCQPEPARRLVRRPLLLPLLQLRHRLHHRLLRLRLPQRLRPPLRPHPLRHLLRHLLQHLLLPPRPHPHRPHRLHRLLLRRPHHHPLLLLLHLLHRSPHHHQTLEHPPPRSALTPLHSSMELRLLSHRP